MISIRLFCCCEKVFTHINTWMTGNIQQNIIIRETRFLQSHKQGFIDADYIHASGVCKDFEIKHLSEDHDLHV